MMESPSEVWIFGPFRLDPSSHSVARRVPGEPDARIALRPKAFDLLWYMVRNAGRTISQDEFLSELWPETYVQPEVLKGHVLAVRAALDDRGTAPLYIETVRGRGYRFIAEVGTRWRDVAGGDEKRSDPLLVGRDDVRAELATALNRAGAGEAQIVFLSGEAGIGKTTLAEAFTSAATTQGAMVIAGHCLPGSSETEAYYPILEMLTALSGGDFGDTLKEALARLAPAWLVQLPGLATEAAADLRHEVIVATPHRMARELCDALDALARKSPVVILLEDIHWADQATLDLLQALASRKLRSKLMVVATLRSSVTSDTDRSAGTLAHRLSLYRLAREIRLEPLSLGHVDTFLSALAMSEPPEILSALLHRRSEGNPLFMRAMLDVLLERNLVSWSDTGWRLCAGFEQLGSGAPPSLAQIIEAEIDELSPEERAVLDAASISNGPFSAPVNHVATHLDEVAFEAACESMCRRGQLIRRQDMVTLPGGRRTQSYGFRHALFREVAYDRQGALRRAGAHAEVGRRLTDIHVADLPSVAPSLARHFEQAGYWPESIHFLRISARTTMQRFAHREAATLLEQAIAFSRNLPDGDRVPAELGALEELATIDLGVFDPRAVATYERLSRLAHDHDLVDVEARGLIGMAYALSWTDSDRSLDMMRQALELSVEIQDPVQRARVRCSAQGWLSYIQGWNAADAAGVRTEMETLRDLGDPIAFHLSLVYYSLMHFSAARYGEAIDMVDTGFSFLVAHAQEAHVDLGVPLWIYRLGTAWCQMSAGRLGEALEGFSRGTLAYEANGDLGRSVTLRIYHAFLHVWLHDHQAALDLLDDTLSRVGAGGGKLSPNDARVERIVRGLAELGRGEVALALEHLTLAEVEMRDRNTLSSWYWRLALSWGLTDTHLARGDIPSASVCAERFLEQALATEERNWRALAGDACAHVALLQGDGLAAREYLRRAWEDILGYDAPLARCRLLATEARVSELLEEPDAAARHTASRTATLKGLAATLPDGHPGRHTLLAGERPSGPPGLRLLSARA